MNANGNTRRDFLKAMGLGAAAMAVHSSTSVAGALSGGDRKAKPNIILVLTDDQGWTDTSVQMMAGRPDSKSDYYQMPNLEKLAREGMVFSDAYSPAPVCVPTRCSIQFGKTPARLKNTCHVRDAGDCMGEISIARMIKAADPAYATAHFGKWGLSYTPTPLSEMGYDKSDGRTNNYHGDWRSITDKRPVPLDDPKRIFSLAKRANEFMQEQTKAGRPFFIQLSHYALHSQHRALKETIEKYRLLPPGKKCTPADYQSPPPGVNDWALEYAAMIEDMDTGLGMLLDKLDELGIADNTYIIFVGDNGGSFRGNEPLRGRKGQVWEGGIRVPMVVRGPGIKPASRCSVPVVGWDFLPTFVDLAGGGKKVLSKNLDGGSLRPLFENAGRGKIHRPAEGLIFHYPFHESPTSAIRVGDYKLLKDWETGEIQLYNLADDLGETQDLAAKMPKKANQLHQRLLKYLDSVNAEKADDIHLARIEQLTEEKRQIEKQIREVLESDDAKASEKWSNLNLRLGFFNSSLEHQQKRLDRIKQLKRKKR